MIPRSVWFLPLLSLVFSLSGSAQEPNTGTLSIGAYYYPWYRAADGEETGWMSKALRGRLTPQQLPKLGVYGSRDPSVIGDHIAQSVRAGVDFWAVSWWGPGKREDRALREHILTHPDSGNLKYAILYESTGRLGPMQEPNYDNLLDDFTYMKEMYFDHPGYLMIDGKPVVFIYLTRVYFRDQGLEPLAQLRNQFPDVYLIGDDVFGGRYHERHARLWNAVTAYDVYGQSMQQDGATQAAVDRLRGNYENAKRLANGVGTAFIPGIAPGYNDRAVRNGHVGRARAFSDQPDSREGDIFRTMIEEVAIPLTDAKANRTIMITSFNEWYEDTQIEATQGGAPATTEDDSDTGTFYTEGGRYVDYGPLYLDILRKAKDAAPLGQAENAASVDDEAAKPEATLEPVGVSVDRQHFVRGVSDEPFQIWGVNYDHDGAGRLLDEYWDHEWETVVADFHEIKELGANCVRIHLQLGKFMEGPDKPKAAALVRLTKLVKLAEATRLYLDVTGLACYHKENIPEWYDQLGEDERWTTQAMFWEAVAKVCAGSPAIFCYDLMNEPILPGKEPAGEWLAGELGGKFFVQRISLDLKERSREEVAEAWVKRLVDAIRKHDESHLITVGVIPWVFTFGGGKPLFHGPRAGKHLDFVAVHFYPNAGEVDKALEALKAYEIGKPLVIEEMFPLKCSQQELIDFVDQSAKHADGWISFYWGQTAKELRAKDSPSIGEAVTASWLEVFQANAPAQKPERRSGAVELINFNDEGNIASRRPIMIAHRGGVVSSRSHECSLTAIRLAADMGYDMVELDIQRSSDGVAMVFHDQSLTKACGKSGSVSDFKATELEAIPYLTGDDSIIRLETALKSCRHLGLGVMLDLKAGGDSREFLEQIDKLLVKHELVDSTISISGSEPARGFLEHVRFTPTDDEMLRLRKGEALDLSHRFWFGLPIRLQPGDVGKLRAAKALIIPAINTFRYPEKEHLSHARNDIKQLTEQGVDGFQIDSIYFSLLSDLKKKLQAK